MNSEGAETKLKNVLAFLCYEGEELQLLFQTPKGHK